MSGLDEVRLKMIPNPTNGQIPRYWAGMDVFGHIFCWLQQNVKPGTKEEYSKNVIVANEYMETIAREKESFFDKITTVRCVGDGISDFGGSIVETVKKELLRNYRKEGYTSNVWP